MSLNLSIVHFTYMNALIGSMHLINGLILDGITLDNFTLVITKGHLKHLYGRRGVHSGSHGPLRLDVCRMSSP